MTNLRCTEEYHLIKENIFTNLTLQLQKKKRLTFDVT